jgi:hypothetical protein
MHVQADGAPSASIAPHRPRWGGRCRRRNTCGSWVALPRCCFLVPPALWHRRGVWQTPLIPGLDGVLNKRDRRWYYLYDFNLTKSRAGCILRMTWSGAGLLLPFTDYERKI